MKAVKINPEESSVKIIDYNPKKDDITLLQSLIGCRTFGGIGYTYDNQAGTIFYDDEALLFNKSFFVRFFSYLPDLYPMPIAGNLLILGVDVDSGESISIPKVLSDNLIDGGCQVKFPTVSEVIEIERDLMKKANVS
jgi:hypothetical protein